MEINLVGVQFVNGIAFTFDADSMLGPGERALLVGNAEAFALRYPEALSRVMGQFEGSLRDSGETLELLDVATKFGRICRPNVADVCRSSIPHGDPGPSGSVDSTPGSRPGPRDIR